MSQREKLLLKVSNNLKDVRFSDLQKLLEWDGWVLHTSSSNHYTYLKRGVGRLTVPKKDGKAKECYVKQCLKMMRVEL